MAQNNTFKINEELVLDNISTVFTNYESYLQNLEKECNKYSQKLTFSILICHLRDFTFELFLNSYRLYTSLPQDRQPDLGIIFQHLRMHFIKEKYKLNYKTASHYRRLRSITHFCNCSFCSFLFNFNPKFTRS